MPETKLPAPLETLHRAFKLLKRYPNLSAGSKPTKISRHESLK